MFEHLVSYLVAAMIAWCPPSIHRHTGDTDGQTEQRYTALATNIAWVALDPNEAPLFSDEEGGRARTALLIAAIASYESKQFSKEIDSDRGTGDHGNAFCTMQIHMQTHGSLDCYHKALIYLHSSFHNCSRLPLLSRMAEYTSGNCYHGTIASAIRVGREENWWKANPFTIEIDSSELALYP
jgi:hypothetical protein